MVFTVMISVLIIVKTTSHAYGHVNLQETTELRIIHACIATLSLSAAIANYS